MPITIRKFADGDLPDVLEMIHGLAACHGDRSPLTLDALRRDVCGAHPWLTVLVADGGSRRLGYAALLPKAQLQFGTRGMEIHHLFVCRAAQGNGLGAGLVQACVAEARAHGCSFLSVGTHPDNHKAARFYAQIGFLRRSGSGPRFTMQLNHPPT